MTYETLDAATVARLAQPSDLSEAAQAEVRRRLDPQGGRVYLWGPFISCFYEDGWWQGAPLKAAEVATGNTKGAVDLLIRARDLHLSASRQRSLRDGRRRAGGATPKSRAET